MKDVLKICFLLCVPLAVYGQHEVVRDSDNSYAKYTQTAREIRMLHRELRVGEVITSIDQVLTQNVKEVVAERHNESSSSGLRGAINLLFLSLSGQASESSSSRWDVTKLIVQNPTEVAKFDRKAQAGFRNVQTNLIKYMENNEKELIHLKELGLQNLAAAYELIQAGERIPIAELEETAALVMDLNFLGVHEVTRCVRVKYANRSSRSHDSGSFGARGRFLFFSANLGGESEQKKYWRQLAHTETKCESNTNQIKLHSDSTVYYVNLSRLDRMLEDWIVAVDLALLANTKAPYYPTWESPYYND